MKNISTNLFKTSVKEGTLTDKHDKLGYTYKNRFSSLQYLVFLQKLYFNVALQ